MKYRIKETDYKFYPQRKIFIFWIYFDGEPYKYWDEFFGDRIGYKNLYFNSLKEAQSFIDEDKKKRKVTYHEI